MTDTVLAPDGGGDRGYGRMRADVGDTYGSHDNSGPSNGGGEGGETAGGRNSLPPDNSQLKHMFRDADGHLPDTAENRELIEKLVNDENCKKGPMTAVLIGTGSMMKMTLKSGLPSETALCRIAGRTTPRANGIRKLALALTDPRAMGSIRGDDRNERRRI